MPFYGNITNRRNQFTYDKVYPNKKALLQAISYENSEHINLDNINNYNKITIEKDSDGVFIGRYVLIDYGQMSGVEGFETEHIKNYQIDNASVATGLQRSWDQTVWQKVYTDGILNYVLIAELNAKQAQLELERYSPSYRGYKESQKMPLSYEQKDGEENHFIIRAQDSYQFDLTVPELKHPDQNENNTINFPYAEIDPNKIDIINSAGFNPTKRNYLPNIPKAFFTINERYSGEKYYEAGQGTQADIISMNIDLREIGNIVSNFYDILFSEHRDIVKDIDNISNIDINTAKDEFLYKVNSTYYRRAYDFDKKIYIWEPVFDLSKTAEEVGAGSLFELMSNLQSLQKLSETKVDNISDLQQSVILGYFNNNIASEINQQLGEIMELKYLGYDATNKHHKMQYTKFLEKTEGILSGTVKFGENFVFGDKIVLFNAPADGSADGSNPIVDAENKPVEFTVIMTNGTEATTGAWSKNTIGLVNFDLGQTDSNHAYIYSAVPVWA